MKKLLAAFFLLSASAAFAQPKIINQAVITTKTTIVTPENDDQPAGNFTSDNGEQVRVMRFGGDGETKTTTWVKSSLVKTFSESEMGRTTVIRDNDKKITTTIMEMMGRKTGFYATDEDQEMMRKRMDSMMQSGGQNSLRSNDNKAPEIKIIYQDDSKKISGIACKKALILSTRGNKTDSTVVWYDPAIKLEHLSNTGGSMGGFGGFNTQAGPSGFEKLEGFPIQYERTLNRGRKMTVQVTKMVTDKEIADKEFEVPKDVEVKPMKDMQNAGPGNFQMRIDRAN